MYGGTSEIHSPPSGAIAAVRIEGGTIGSSPSAVFRVGHFEGSDRIYRTSLRAMSAGRHAVGGVVIALADVENLDTEQAARATMHRMRDVSSTAHELRAQLMTLLLWENLLRSELLRPDDHQRALQAIRDSASTLSTLVGRLLAAATAT